MLHTCVTLISSVLFALASGQTPVGPKLYLYDAVLSSDYLSAGNFDSLPGIAGHEISTASQDFTGNTQLINMMKKTRSYCVDGVWRFFPKKGFLADPFSDNPNGITLGIGQSRFCKNADTGAGADLASMKSYRYLGPVTWKTEYSMAVYEGYYFSGRNITVVRTLKGTEMPYDVEIDFNVKSFVISAPVDLNDNQNRLLCSSWNVNILVNPNIELCYNLCNRPGIQGDLPKIFMEGVHRDRSFNSLRFVQHFDATGNSVECGGQTSVLVTVPP